MITKRTPLSLALVFSIAVGTDSCGPNATNPPGAYAGGNIITPPGTGVRNVVAVIADSGPAGAGGYTDGLFVTITVCVPGQSGQDQCQQIDHVLLDTGSVGLKVLAQGTNEGGELSLTLPAVTDAGGRPVTECAQFLDGYTWGPMVLADVAIGGDTAASVPIQIVSEQTYSPPSSCTSTGASEDMLTGPNGTGLGANGILGIGLFLYDCGEACAPSTTQNPGWYYSCSGSPGPCQVATVDLTSQATNPVVRFATDSNGTIIELPVIDAAGVPSTTGSLVFGIGTLANNQLGSSTRVPTDACGQFTTSFGGADYPNSFIDSGSNAFFFLQDSLVSGAGIHSCTGNYTQFYCTNARTTAPVGLTATDAADSGQNGLVGFGIADAEALFNTTSYAFSDLGGAEPTSYDCNTGQNGGPTFDWGLPFFFGRNVYTAIENPNNLGTGMYNAFN